jgi:hypothetical protein
VSGLPPSGSESPPTGIPPPIPPGASRLAAAGKFVAGSILAIGAGVLVFVSLVKDVKNVTGCATIQLVYIVPIVVFLLFKRQPAWAFGIVFGGAVVVLLGSICSGMRFGG